MIFLNWKKSRNYASDYTINHYRNSKPFQTCIAQKCPKKEKTRLIALVGAVSSLSLHRNCDEKVDAINGTRYTKDKLRAACIQPAKYREMGWPLARVWRRRGAQISSCVSSEGGRWTGLFGSKLDCAHVTRGKSSRHRAARSGIRADVESRIEEDTEHATLYDSISNGLNSSIELSFVLWNFDKFDKF